MVVVVADVVVSAVEPERVSGSGRSTERASFCSCKHRWLPNMKRKHKHVNSVMLLPVKRKKSYEDVLR